MNRPRRWVVVLVAVLVVIAAYLLGGLGEEPANLDGPTPEASE